MLSRFAVRFFIGRNFVYSYARPIMLTGSIASASKKKTAPSEYMGKSFGAPLGGSPAIAIKKTVRASLRTQPNKTNTY